MGLKKDVAEKWSTALRSGEYVKCNNQLRYRATFCALGVLCDLAVKETGNVRWTDYDYLVNYDGQDAVFHAPNDFVSVWAMQHRYSSCWTIDMDVLKAKYAGSEELNSVLARFNDHYKDSDIPSVIWIDQLNDFGLPFNILADIIDACWEDIS